MTRSAAALRARYTGDGKVYLGSRLILDVEQEKLGCFGVLDIPYSPAGEYFVVVLQRFEDDYEAFLFRADGSGRQRITAQWDYIKGNDYQWSPDSQAFLYQRINSCCAVPPADAPPVGRVRYDIETGAKTLLEIPVPPAGLYRVVNVQSNDVLNIRSGPGIEYMIIGSIPPDGIGIRMTGAGVTRGSVVWAPITYMSVTGWVNATYLASQP